MVERGHPTDLVRRTFENLKWDPRSGACDPETHGFIPIEISYEELAFLVAEKGYSLYLFGASPGTRLYAVKGWDKKVVMHEDHVLMVETLPGEDPRLLWICDDSFRALNDIMSGNFGSQQTP